MDAPAFFEKRVFEFFLLLLLLLLFVFLLRRKHDHFADLQRKIDAPETIEKRVWAPQLSSKNAFLNFMRIPKFNGSADVT